MTRGGSGVCCGGASSRRVGAGQHDMGIGPAKPEGVDAGVRPLGAFDRLDVANQPQIQRVERDFRVGRLAMDGRRHDFPIERERRLEQPGHSGCRLQMADIGLYRSDRAADTTGSVRENARPRRPRSGRPPACRCRASRKTRDRPEQSRRDRTPSATGTPAPTSLGSDKPIVRPSELTAGSPNHRADPILVGERVRERLQDDDAAALAADVAVGSLVEGKAAAAPRQHRGAREPDKRIGREQQVDPADDRGGDALVANCLASMVQGDERRRAGRVDGEARPAQIEDVGNSVGQDAERAPGHEIGIGARRVSESQIGIIGRGGADIDARSAARHLAGRNAGIFERVPDEFQQQPLLRIHLRRFARRDPEEGRLEQIDAGDQPGRPSIALARLAAVGMVIEAGRPPPVVDLGDRIARRCEQLPELLEVFGPGESAGRSDDRDRFVSHSVRTKSAAPGKTSVTLAA